MMVVYRMLTPITLADAALRPRIRCPSRSTRVHLGSVLRAVADPGSGGQEKWCL